MGVVASVNVGLPRDTPWQGKTVRTSIWKYPVSGRVFAGRLNLAGDAQADLVGHGGEHRAVMVYQLESYRYWAELLRRPDFPYGQFGENLTVSGLADAEVCIGDRFRIGGAVFEVTQPRVTCFKLGLRMDHPQMPALVVRHRRPGFYFRVLEEGEVGAGDAIEKIADGPGRMSVAEIDALLYTADHPTDALRRALQIPALSPGWQGSIRSLLDATIAGDRAGNAGLSSARLVVPAWRGLRKLHVLASRQESDDVRSFELAAEDGSPLPDALPGQHLAVRLQPQPDAAPVTRNYSLCGKPGQGVFRIAVKREDRGIASAWLHEHVRPGFVIESSAPRGSFILAPGTGPVVLISAGVGVTPLLAMLYAVAAAKETPREVWWIHAARDRTHHPFAAEVRALMQDLPTGRSVIVYSRPGPNERAGVDYDFEGHLDLALFRRTGLPQDADYYLCGPAGFLEAVNRQLGENDIPATRIHVEWFGPAASASAPANTRPHAPAGTPGTGPIVTFARAGLAVPWDARFGSLLELAEACDLPVKWSCRSGVCHICESGLIDGGVRYSPDPVDAPGDGFVLICCSTPTSNVDLDL